jgi:membrane-associated phospholipid phosphatase
MASSILSPRWLAVIFLLILAGDGNALQSKLHIPQRALRLGRADSTPLPQLAAVEKNDVEQTILRRGVPTLFYTLNSSTKWIVAAAHTFAVWSRPGAFIGPHIVVGSILAVYFSDDFLKKIINQSRPIGSPLIDPGMPSSHSLVSFFAAVAWMYVHPTKMGNALLLGAASSIALLRVVCGYHTFAQIAVGAVVGSVLGPSWVMLGKALNSFNPRLAFCMAWSFYLSGAAFYIARNMRKWVTTDAHV